MHIQTLPEIRPIPTYLPLRKTETFVGRMTNGCLLLVIEMQSDVWQEIPDFDGADVEQKWIEGNPGYNLRVLHWTPTNEDCKRARTLVMIPGWNSVPEGWFPILSEWVRQRPVVYIETREKGSCRIENKISKETFQIQNIASDLSIVLAAMGLDPSNCDAMGSSLGATLLLEGVREEQLVFRSIVVLSPNLAFVPPIWARPLIPAPLFLYNALVKFVIWYLDKRLKEEGQRIRYRRTLLAAPIDRLRLCAIVFRKYKMNLDFSNTNAHVGILRASSDTLHDHSDAGDLSKNIPNSKLIEIESNQFAHEAAAIPVIEDFMDNIA